MDLKSLLLLFAVGALAGWLSNIVIKDSGYSVKSNIAMGVVGAVLGGLIFSLLGLTQGGFLSSIIMGTIGAIILLSITHLVKRI